MPIRLKSDESKKDVDHPGNHLGFVRFGDVQGYDTVTKKVVSGLSRIIDHKRNGRLYASVAAMCARQAALQASRSDIEVQSAANTAYYAMGVAIEQLVTDGLYQSGALLFKQFKLPDVGINLGGYIDAIIHIGGCIRLLEIKSCGEIPSKPKPDHAAQAYIYSAVTGIPAIVLYFSRKVAKFTGEMMIKEFELPNDQNAQRMALYQATYGHLAVLNNVVPEKPHHITTRSMCGFCPFQPFCWDGDPMDLTWPQVDPVKHKRLVEEANAIVEDLMRPEAIIDRRNGVLRHLERVGNARVKELLSNSSWDDLV